MDRQLGIESIAGEIALVIGYAPGESEAIAVLQGALRLIESLDRLDHCLLSSIDTTLEPVSILNDVQHSSLKILLARALRKVPDEAVGSLDWKKWVGGLLVKGKHGLLSKLESDVPEIRRVVDALAADYQAAPGLIGYDPPKVVDVRDALDGVMAARAGLPGHSVKIQTELGDVLLPDVMPLSVPADVADGSITTVTNQGRERLKIKTVDMLGQSQWTVIRGGRSTKVDILHRAWLEGYQSRHTPLLPGDSLDCTLRRNHHLRRPPE